MWEKEYEGAWSKGNEGTMGCGCTELGCQGVGCEGVRMQFKQ